MAGSGTLFPPGISITLIYTHQSDAYRLQCDPKRFDEFILKDDYKEGPEGRLIFKQPKAFLKSCTIQVDRQTLVPQITASLERELALGQIAVMYHYRFNV